MEVAFTIVIAIIGRALCAERAFDDDEGKDLLSRPRGSIDDYATAVICCRV